MHDEATSTKSFNAERECHRQRRVAAQPDWTDLPVRSHPGPLHSALHSALEQCYHWEGRLLSGETESFCCCGGKIAIAPPPALWKEVFQGPAFRAHSRQYNNLFTFTTVMGVSGHTAGDTAPHSHPVRSTSLVCVNSLRFNLKLINIPFFRKEHQSVHGILPARVSSCIHSTQDALSGGAHRTMDPEMGDNTQNDGRAGRREHSCHLQQDRTLLPQHDSQQNRST